MIGYAYVSSFPYYDMQTRQMRFKNRPVLVIGRADSKDYVVLPISRVTNRAHLDAHCDVEVKPGDVPLMNLHSTSYIRTHKQTVLYAASLIRPIVDFRTEYPDVYIDVIAKVEEFQKNMLDNAF